MEQGVLKTDDLNPDGVRIVVAWDELVVGASFSYRESQRLPKLAPAAYIEWRGFF